MERVRDLPDPSVDESGSECQSALEAESLILTLARQAKVHSSAAAGGLVVVFLEWPPKNPNNNKRWRKPFLCLRPTSITRSLICNHCQNVSPRPSREVGFLSLTRQKSYGTKLYPRYR